MTHHVFFLLLLCALLFSLTRLCFLCGPHHKLAKLAIARRSGRSRPLKPRSPDDCPACRLAFPASPNVVPASATVQPWCEVKSRRGAPKRIPTRASPAPTSSAPTTARQAHTSMLMLAVASTAKPSASRPFALRRAAPHSVLDVIPPCTI